MPVGSWLPPGPCSNTLHMQHSGPGPFHVDLARVDLHAMHCHRLLADDEQTLAAADAVISHSTARPEATSPMCYAEAQLVKACILARRHEPQAALASATSALSLDRRSLPTLLPLARQFSAELHRSMGRSPSLRTIDQQISRPQASGTFCRGVAPSTRAAKNLKRTAPGFGEQHAAAVESQMPIIITPTAGMMSWSGPVLAGLARSRQSRPGEDSECLSWPAG